MSLENTKPKWAPHSIATERGWTDPVTGEVYVAIGNLKARLEAITKPEINVSADTVELEQPKEVIMQEEVKVEDAPQQKRRGRPSKVITEVVEQPLQEGQRVIGEVVEETNKQILGE